MKFKIVDRGTKAEVRYVSYMKEQFLFFPLWTWTMLGGTSTEEKAEALCQRHRDSQKPKTEKVRVLTIP